jgi:two-component system sensor histidine kinase/response regulator
MVKSMMDNYFINVLLVEDNLGDANLIKKRLKKSNTTRFKITHVAKLKKAIEYIIQDFFDIILLDLSLPDSKGLETLAAIEQQATHIPIIVLTGLNDEELALEAVRQGAQDYLRKGLIVSELLVHALRSAIERKRTQEQLRRQKQQLEIANQILEQRTQQLEALNAELEAFSYTVSHDLRSPLISIDGYSCFLEQQYGANLDQRGRRYLNNIRQATQRMNQLIEDLLMLSRVQKTVLSITSFNLSQMIQAIAQELQQQHPLDQVNIKITPDIVAYGDQRLLRIALENLLSNAWKYSARKPQPQIEFSVQSSTPQTTYLIRDNGIGFNIEQADQLFRPFHRLHSSDKYPGTGIGLATVQRIIHRHHGQIWAEASVGKGATFYFTLGIDPLSVR